MIEVITQYPGWSAEQIERAMMYFMTLPDEIGNFNPATFSALAVVTATIPPSPW